MKERQHYTFLSPVVGFGGLEMQTVKRAADARQRGDGALLVTLPETEIERHAKSLDLPVAQLDIRFRYLNVWAAYRLGRIMKRAHSSVCVVSSTRDLSVAILARDLCVRDLAVVLYQQIQFSRKKKDPFHDWIYRSLDGAVVLTNRMRKTLSERTVFPIEKIQVVPYGLDLEVFDPGNHQKLDNRKRFGLPQDGFIIGLIGRIAPEKGQKTAIQAFAKAAIPNSTLVLCGGCSVRLQDYFESLKRISRDLGVEGSVRFLPFTDEIPMLMNSLDLFLLPSEAETFGLVNIEAMASGVPVIATEAGGVPEIIQHGENGMLFHPGDAEAAAGFMKLLAKNHDLRARMGKHAREDALNRYAYRRQTDQFFDFCRNAYLRRQRKR
jgi:glycosyltransferase involved in cell wall biosynthesis